MFNKCDNGSWKNTKKSKKIVTINEHYYYEWEKTNGEFLLNAQKITQCTVYRKCSMCYQEKLCLVLLYVKREKNEKVSKTLLNSMA
jgi:hypothetical protein